MRGWACVASTVLLGFRLLSQGVWYGVRGDQAKEEEEPVGGQWGHREISVRAWMRVWAVASRARVVDIAHAARVSASGEVRG